MTETQTPEEAVRHERMAGHFRIVTGIVTGLALYGAGVALAQTHDVAPNDATMTIDNPLSDIDIRMDTVETIGYTMTIMGAGLAGAGAAFELDILRHRRREAKEDDS
jgi:hypothetical protein